MENLKAIISFIVSVSGGILSQFFGVWNELLDVVIIMMFIDIITGTIVAFMGLSSKSEKGYVNSKSFFKGVCKKVLMWCLIIIAHQADRVLHVDVVMVSVSYWMIASEGLSVIENIGNIGIDIPILTQFFEQIKSKGDNKNDGNVE